MILCFGYTHTTSYTKYPNLSNGIFTDSLKSSAESEKQRQREEKRLARQKELEAKRAARKGGALKLGSKLS